MKSAYELALERSGGGLVKVDDDKKAKIAELDKKYKAKLVEAKMAAAERSKAAGGDLVRLEEISKELEVETASIESKWEKEKDSVRNS